ncbi:DNA-binding transcriptional regulator, MarR family [Amycolatopsis arida]|uniref:DNA-binding transcriptional regulator, MarR family n=1 Tax=Amycolatopsis arida TaxID=587909 RepID=A0A1I5TNT7_9PSEU|nr:MarR family winged helix-turn-helix transcriptional regulator [Amycolatopsis arida]TDX96026.1 DNA-binding MarR family transcriptional regulator [Amycolatopsis arida]SFP84764.1 DNA-binding transcriptional regulator, MarR family [Amycolatopsis arida]
MDTSPDRPIGYWPRHVHELLESTMTVRLADQRLTRRHWQALNAVTETAPIAPAELADRLAPFHTAEPPTLDTALADLTTRGWLGTDTEGRIVPTPAGRQEHARARGAIANYRKRTVEGISQRQYADMVATLRRMADNLERMAAEQGIPPEAGTPYASS